MRTSRWLLATYAAIILFGLVTALPNLFSQPTLAKFPGWLPKQQVTLGLDLRGGSHLVLEVDARALIQERVQSLFSEARRALREVGIDTKSVQRGHDAVTIALEDATRQADAVRTLQRLGAPIGALEPQPVGQEHDAQAEAQGQRGLRHQISIAHRGVLHCMAMAIIYAVRDRNGTGNSCKRSLRQCKTGSTGTICRRSRC